MSGLSGQDLVKWACQQKEAELAHQYKADMAALRVSTSQKLLDCYQRTYSGTLELLGEGATPDQCRIAILDACGVTPESDSANCLLDAIVDAAEGRPMRETADPLWLPASWKDELPE
jgi:hypothetical protein